MTDATENEYETDDSSTLRRTVLQTTAAAGAALGIGATATAQETDADIELGGRTSGWVGVAPEDIADERNPTLELTAGEEYTLVWENLDGAGHNFIIEDADGEEEFVNTEILSDSGETQTVEFTAEEGMAEYFCGPHPTSMRGEISFDGEDGGEEETEDEAAEDGPEAVQEFAAAVDEVVTLTLDEEGWHPAESTDAAADETNPTLELQAGDVYVVTWTNELAASGGETDGEAGTEAGNETAENGGDGNGGNGERHVPEDGDEEGGGDGDANELVILAEEDQAFVRSNETPPGESSAVTFVAPAELEAYRDSATGTEGAIEVEGEIGEGEGDGDGDDVEDLFLDPPDEDGDGNATDENATDENATDESGG